MLRVLARGFLAVAGMLALLLWAMVWFDQPRFGAALGPVATTPLAEATLRADVGGFFGAWAIGALLAAWRGTPRDVQMPMLLLGLAFAGRLVSIALTGDTATVPPMMAEAILFVLMLLARRALRAG